jgi:hypothetical protein
MGKGFLCLFSGLMVFACLNLSSAEYYVDNVKGDDANQGTKEAPFKTLAKSQKALRGGDVLHMVPNPEHPYQEVIDSHPNGKWAGTKEKPTIIDGHGSVISRLMHLKADKWKAEGKGIFSRPLPNNAWVMDRQGYWSGFPIVFFDGKPAEFRKSKDELQDFTYFLYKDYPKKPGDKRSELHNTLYIKLPEGKTPDDLKVEAIDSKTNVHVNRSYVIVRNLTSMYTGGDGFATTRSKGIVFDNVRGCYCMDQGMSHHGAEVTVKNSRFDHNAGCGVVDVYPECKTKYINCLFEDDAFRGGVEFHSGEFEMENCVIRNNTGKVISVNKNAKVKLTNCLFWSKDPKYCGVNVGSGELYMKNCTVYNARIGLSIWLWKEKIKIDMSNCAFIGNKLNYSWGKAKVEGNDNFKFDYNFLTPEPLTVYGKKYKPEQWDEYRKATKLDAHSQMKEYTGEKPPYKTGVDIDDKKIGADINLNNLHK